MHDLHHQAPFGEIAPLDGLVRVALVGFAILTDQLGRLGISHVPDALHGLEVELDPVALASLIDEAERVRAEAVHVAQRRRQAAVGEQDGHLVQHLR